MYDKITLYINQSICNDRNGGFNHTEKMSINLGRRKKVEVHNNYHNALNAQHKRCILDNLSFCDLLT